MMLLTIIPLKAGIVLQQDAYDVATKFLNNERKSQSPRSTQSNLRLVHIRLSSISPDMPLFYIFEGEDKDGWVIVAADDRAHQVLGYSLPQGPASGTYRVYRGGSWYSESARCRVSSRTGGTPDKVSSILGLRLAL